MDGYIKRLFTIFACLFLMPALAEQSNKKYHFINNQWLVEEEVPNTNWISRWWRETNKIDRPATWQDFGKLQETDPQSPILQQPAPTFKNPNASLTKIRRRGDKYSVLLGHTGWTVFKDTRKGPELVRGMRLYYNQFESFHSLAALDGKIFSVNDSCTGWMVEEEMNGMKTMRPATLGEMVHFYRTLDEDGIVDDKNVKNL